MTDKLRQAEYLEELLDLLESNESYPGEYFNHRGMYECYDCQSEHENNAEIEHKPECGHHSAVAAAFRKGELVALLREALAGPAEAREPDGFVVEALVDGKWAIQWRPTFDTAEDARKSFADYADGSQLRVAALYTRPAPQQAAPAEGDALTQAARDVLAERQRQISAEGWTPEHDDKHDSGEMAGAAGCYARHVNARSWVVGMENDNYADEPAPDGWPWDAAWWKPTTPRRDLVKAGALILAELERIDRAALQRRRRQATLTGEQIDELARGKTNHHEFARAIEAEVRKQDEALIEQCRAALAEELAAWDIDPPLQHVKDAHDACVVRLGEKT